MNKISIIYIDGVNIYCIITDINKSKGREKQVKVKCVGS
jgi:hypothetical protein